MRTEERCPRRGISEGPDGTILIGSAGAAQLLLKGRQTEQAGFNAELVRRLPQRNPSVLFQEGAAHRAQRATVAPLLTRTAVENRRPVIAAISRRIVDGFRDRGAGVLDEMALALTVGVVAEIIGLTEGSVSDLADRLSRIFELQASRGDSWHGRALYILRAQRALLGIYLGHVRPSILRRRRTRRDDLVSALIEKRSSQLDIVTECVTYGTAGLSTTREFIGVAALHLFASHALRRRFLDGTDDDRRSILGEILRLEPPVSRILRRAVSDIRLADTQKVIAAGRRIAIDLRSVNSDAAIAGAAPHSIDPDRRGSEGGGLSFGYGHHRCPGAFLAIEETAIFLHELLRVPGIRLAESPTLDRHPVSTGYVLRGCRLDIGDDADAGTEREDASADRDDAQSTMSTTRRVIGSTTTTCPFTTV